MNVHTYLLDINWNELVKTIATKTGWQLNVRMLDKNEQ
jgi:hypothetical protein